MRQFANWIIPTAPAGTSDKRAASTEFVTGAISTAVGFSQGTWTPTLTFSTPGDINVVYSTRNGQYLRLGSLVIVNWSILTSTFTFSTASGNVAVSGLPFTTDANFTPITRGPVAHGVGFFFTAGYTGLLVTPDASAITMTFRLFGNSTTIINAGTSNFTSGTNVDLRATVPYVAA